MTRNPSGDADADCRDLFSPHPYAGQSGDPFAGDAVIGRDTNQHVFDIPHIAMHIAAIGPQIENGITDELPGAVIRDVAAAARFMNFDAALVEFVRRGEEVRLRRVQLHAERDDVRMLQQQEKIGHRTRAPLLHQHALQLHRIRVWHDAEPADFERSQA